MTVIEKNINELVPYTNNPRQNDAAVEGVANSIHEFGFKVPIVIDRNNVIVAGHTRLKAAKQLKMETVPCVIADDLTEEQVKAFRLADNKTAELAVWDLPLLEGELAEIQNIDMTLYGFVEVEMEEDPEETHEPDGRERTVNAYNLDDFDENRVAGFYQMPVIKACDYVPDDLIGFKYLFSTDRMNAGVHFFVYDSYFECVWNNPHKYVHRLGEFPCVLTPDFSLYMDMPMAMKIWNVYRSRLIGQIYQDYGMDVIPTLSWAEPETFDFCFDGIEPGGTVAVSTVGVMRDIEAQEIWKAGMDEALKRIRPKTVICYGKQQMEYDFGDAAVKYIYASKGWE